MSAEQDTSRRSRSARRYLDGDSLTDRLMPTLALAVRTLGFSVAMVNVLDEDNQHTLAIVGAERPAAVRRQDSLCDVVVATESAVVTSNAAEDPRFAATPAVVDGSVRSYMGVPVRGREGMTVGAVCVTDPEVRVVEPGQLARLEQFGRVIEDQLDLIRRLREQRKAGAAAIQEIAIAVAGGQVVPWYQPVVELGTGRVVGFEALARLQGPSGRTAEPSSFVPLAEDSDLIIDVDLSVYEQAMVDLRRWQRNDPGLGMNVNISARHFDHEDWIAPLVAATKSADVSPSSVNMELTETVKLPQEPPDARFVQHLKDHGFRVWLDDFGTGWSSLESLLRISADGLKIDRVLTLAMGSPVGNVLVRSVVELARKLQMKTTIEGVETAEQAWQAKALGCDFAQGYLWSAPCPASQIDALFIKSPTIHLTIGSPGSSPADRPEPRRVPTDRVDARGMRLADEALSTSVLDALPDATAVLDRTGTIVAVNHAWRMFSLDNAGSPETTGVGVNYLETCVRASERGSDDARRVAADLRAVLAGDAIEAVFEYPCSSPTARRWFLLRITTLSGPVPGAVASHVNITRRKMAEEELAHAASHDPLTGLANRALLNRRLVKALHTGNTEGRHHQVAVLYVDLNGFTSINDTFGHSAGDEVLLTVAHRLTSVAGPGCTVGRLGRDEFAVVAPRCSAAAMAALKLRIERSLIEMHCVHGQLVAVGGSVGAHLAAAGDDADEVLRLADNRRYRVKKEQQIP